MTETLQSVPLALVAVVFLFGLIVGSFLNVVIYRLPKMLERQWQAQCAELAAAAAAHRDPVRSGEVGELGGPDPRIAPGASAGAADERPFNLVTPRSACPHCHTPIAPRHNVPVLGWLWLRGRCAQCRARISARYPIVELLTGLLSALVAWKLGFGVSLVCGLLVTWYLVALAGIDLDHQLLPDILTLPLMWGGLLASLIGTTGAGGHLPVSPREALIGAAAGYLSLWSVFQLFRLATGKEGMGYGDFKLLAALGAWLGWKMLLPIVLLSAAVGALVGIALIAFRRQRAAQPIPFGPFLAAAGFLVMLWGPEGVTAYLGLYTHSP
jgi:leader peptidase (prepilin peptidase) / N-methyltransferase